MKEFIERLGKVSCTPEGQHDKTKTYDRLSIVYDENTNSSYISKKVVPANIDITNEIYWQVLCDGQEIKNNVYIKPKQEWQLCKGNISINAQPHQLFCNSLPYICIPYRIKEYTLIINASNALYFCATSRDYKHINTLEKLASEIGFLGHEDFLPHYSIHDKQDVCYIHFENIPPNSLPYIKPVLPLFPQDDFNRCDYIQLVKDSDGEYLFKPIYSKYNNFSNGSTTVKLNKDIRNHVAPPSIKNLRFYKKDKKDIAFSLLREKNGAIIEINKFLFVDIYNRYGDGHIHNNRYIRLRKYILNSIRDRTFKSEEISKLERLQNIKGNRWINIKNKRLRHNNSYYCRMRYNDKIKYSDYTYFVIHIPTKIESTTPKYMKKVRYDLIKVIK